MVEHIVKECEDLRFGSKIRTSGDLGLPGLSVSCMIMHVIELPLVALLKSQQFRPTVSKTSLEMR